MSFAFFQIKLKISFLLLEIMQGLVNSILRHRVVVASAMRVDAQGGNVITAVFHGFVQRCDEFSSSHFF